MERGADINTRQKQRLGLPLIAACDANKFDVVASLLSHPSLNRSHLVALFTDNLLMVSECLFRAVAARNARVLSAVAKSAHSVGLSASLLNARDPRTGDHLLHLAAATGLPHLVHILVSFGADPTLKSSSGKTACDLATELHHKAVLATLANHPK